MAAPMDSINSSQTSSVNIVEVEEVRGQTVLTTCKSTYPIRLMVPKGGSNKTPVSTAEGLGTKVSCWR